MRERTLTLISPTAVIDGAAQIDPTAEIGPYVVIEGPVRIGARTRVMAHSYLCGSTQIGEDNEIGVGCVIGVKPQHLAYKGEDSGVVIGNGNVFREYVTIHRAYHPGENTIVGDRNFLMVSSHVAHDCRLGNDIVIANGTLLAGHTQIEDRVVLSGNVAVHQFVRIGTMAMVGGLSKIIKDVPPYMLVDGGSKVCGINVVGLRRGGLDAETRQNVKRAYKILYRTGLNVPNAVKQLEETLGDVPQVQRIIRFVQESARGIAKHTRSSAE